MEWFVLAEAAAEAVSQVLVVVACGIVLSKVGHLSHSAQKAVSQVNLYFFTPCLLFTKIASAISWQLFVAFWPIPVFFVLFSSISWTLARVGSKVLRFSKEETRFVTAAIIFFNNNSLPLALMQSLAFSGAGKKLMRDDQDTSEDIVARGVSYILFYSVFDNLVRWSYGLNLLSHHKDDDDTMQRPDEQSRGSHGSHSLHRPGEVIINVERPEDIEAEDNPELERATYLHRQSTNQHPALQSTSYHSLPALKHTARDSHLLSRLKFQASLIWKKIQPLLSPPLVTAILALFVGVIPPLHRLMMDHDSKIYAFLVRPLETCGGAAIPAILVCLGAQVINFDSTETPVEQSGRAGGTEDEERNDARVDHASSDHDESVDERRPLLTSTTTSGDTSSSGTRQSNSTTSSTSRTTTKATDRRTCWRGWISPQVYILICRMLLVPAIALPLIIFCPSSLSPSLTADPTFRLTLMIMISSPSAINLIQICQINGFLEKKMAGVLFWSYCIVGIPCVLVWAVVALWAASRG